MSKSKKRAGPVYITEARVAAALGPAEANRIIERCFRHLHDPGTVQMPSKIYLHLPKGDFRAMPAYTALDGGIVGVKWISVFPENPARNKLPSVIGTLFLNDVGTGSLLAVIEANTVTALRTGAAAAVASKHLARPGSRELGIVGAGFQAGYQIRCLSKIFRFDRIRVWSPFSNEGERFVKRFGSEFPALEFEPDLERCVRSSDILCTCTPSRKPLVLQKWVKPGTHINAIGADAPGKQELETALTRSARIFVDDWAQASHSGEINVPISQGKLSEKNIAGTLTDAVLHPSDRRKDADITIFDSTGLAIQDIMLAGALYRLLIRRPSKRNG